MSQAEKTNYYECRQCCWAIVGADEPPLCPRCGVSCTLMISGFVQLYMTTLTTEPMEGGDTYVNCFYPQRCA
jgi:hypothetical protein